MTRFSLRRPLYIFALTFFACIAGLLHWGEGYGFYVALVSGMIFIVVTMLPFLRRFMILSVVSLALLSASLLTVSQYYVRVNPLRELADTSEMIAVKVKSLPEKDSSMYRVEVVKSDTIPKGTNFSVSFDNKSLEFSKNTILEGETSLYLPSWENASLKSDGIFLCGYMKDSEIIDSGKVVWYEILADSIREKVLSGFHKILPGEEGNVLSAILLGDLSDVSMKTQKDFRDSGLSHLLVVSGLHMTILSGAVYLVFHSLRFPRWLTLIFTLGAVWLFMLLVGFSFSVIRAAVMLHLVLISQVFKWRADSRTSLGVALLLILSIDPYAAADVGFLLSFSATLGIIVLTPVLEEFFSSLYLIQKYPRLLPFFTVFSCPIAAMVFTAPITAVAFHRLTILSPLSNLLTVWPSTLLLPISALSAVFICIPYGTVLAKGLLFVAGLLTKWIIAVADWFARIPFGNLQIRQPVILLLLVMIPLALYWSWKWTKMRGLRVTAIVATVLLVFCSSVTTILSYKTVSLRVLGDETALCAVMETAGRHIVILSGENKSDLYASYRFLSDCGVSKPDALIITNGNSDVTVPLAELLQQFPAETVIYPENESDFTIGIHGIEREMVDKSAAFTLWNNTVLRYCEGWWRVDVGQTRFLFSPNNGNTAQLPKGWENAHLAVFYGTVPRNVSALNLEQAVMIAQNKELRFMTSQLPWGSYPIHLTATDGTLSYMTAGKGDLMRADRYWL